MRKIEAKQFSRETLKAMKKAFPDIELPKQVLSAEQKRKAELNKPIFLKRYE